jgi:hypothetical protein
MTATARHISGGAGRWKSPYPDLARAWVGQPAQATQHAPVSGGATGTSVEARVMGVEQSGGVVRSMWYVNSETRKSV